MLIYHGCILALYNEDCLPEWERSSSRRPSSPRRLSPFCPRTQTACRIYTPHDLCVASTLHITLCIVLPPLCSLPTERQSCFIADYKMFVCARYNYLAYIYGPMSILFHALGLFEFCHNSFKKHLFPQDKNSFLTTVLIQKYAHDNAQNLLIIGRWVSEIQCSVSMETFIHRDYRHYTESGVSTLVYFTLIQQYFLICTDFYF